MVLYVRYKDGRSDYVHSLFLGTLIRDKEISMFYRPSERQWIDVESGRLRREGRSGYDGVERRTRTPFRD